MNQRAAVDRDFPKVPVLHWVLTFPTRLRYFAHRDPALVGRVLAVALRALQARLRECCPGAPASGRFGAATFIQRYRVDEILPARATPLECDAGTDPRARSRLPVQLLAPGSQFQSCTRASIYTVDAEGIAADGVRARRQAVIQSTANPKRPYLSLAGRDALLRSKPSTGAQMTATGLE